MVSSAEHSLNIDRSIVVNVEGSDISFKLVHHASVSAPVDVTPSGISNNLERMTREETDAQLLNSIDSESTDPILVIYQSGYLTIKGYDKEFGIYSLGFPNREVEEGFIKFLLPFYANVSKNESPFEIQKFVREVRSGDYDSF